MAQGAVTGLAAKPMPVRISAWAIYDGFDVAGGEQRREAPSRQPSDDGERVERIGAGRGDLTVADELEPLGAAPGG